MTLTILASLLVIVLGIVVMRAHPLILLATGLVLGLAGLAEHGCTPGQPLLAFGAAGLVCTDFGRELASVMFAFALIFLVPAVFKLVRREREGE